MRDPLRQTSEAPDQRRKIVDVRNGKGGQRAALRHSLTNPYLTAVLTEPCTVVGRSTSTLRPSSLSWKEKRRGAVVGSCRIGAGAGTSGPCTVYESQVALITEATVG
jgi:hypothetical protein